MNGPHDLGGMHGFGPVQPEPNEPAFHDEWERRAFALTIAMGARGEWSLDRMRLMRESQDPAIYWDSSYYEIWLTGLLRLLEEKGHVSAAELEKRIALLAEEEST